VTEELFNVVIFFPDGSNEYVGRGLDAEPAVLMARDYATRPAAVAGFIERIMITDMDDLCCFLWQFGKGVVFPKRGAAS
jgi:uncharacterized Rossmann fold enzyme